MTSRPPYKRRLQQHLRETRDQARQLERRIKQLGGKAHATPAVPRGAPDLVGETAAAVTSVASKAVAAARGPVHAIRGTGEAEKMLKNAKTEYFNEFEEIATYTAIETLASEVGDRETARLARDIRRQEERMATFLERLIPQLTKAVVRDEIPASERRNSGRRTARSPSRAAGSGRKGSAARRGHSARSRSASSAGRRRSSRSRRSS
jgi:ferritin-like metal-binding protein YciE